MTEKKTGQDRAGQSDTTLGGRLQARRLELGWSLEDVESSLRIRRKILQAIEGERYSELPDKVYALGFIKSYARFLGLDGEDVLVQARKELASFVPKRRMVNLELPGPQEGRSFGIWILLAVGLLVIVGGYVGWYHFYARDSRLTSAILPQHLTEKAGEGGGAVPVATTRSSMTSGQPSGPQADTGEPPAGKEPQPSAQSGAGKADETQKDVPDLPPPPETTVPDAARQDDGGDDGHAGSSDAAKDRAGSGEPAHSTPATPAPATPVPSAAGPAGTVSAGSTQKVSPSTRQESSPPAAPASAGKTESPVPGGKDAGDSVSIHVLENSWVHIVDASGTSLVGHVLKKGEVWRGVPGATYHVTSGNAGGVVLQAGNVVSAPLGPRGRIARDVVVNAALVEQGRYGHGVLPAGVAQAAAHH